MFVKKILLMILITVVVSLIIRAILRYFFPEFTIAYGPFITGSIGGIVGAWIAGKSKIGKETKDNE